MLKQMFKFDLCERSVNLKVQCIKVRLHDQNIYTQPLESLNCHNIENSRSELRYRRLYELNRWTEDSRIITWIKIKICMT